MLTKIEGTIWAANRGAHTIQGFDARTGEVVRTVSMAPSSQPGDLAFARGKLYVAEEYPPPAIVAGAQPEIAPIVDPGSGDVLERIPIGTEPSSTVQSWRPHHVHASRDGRFVAFGLYGTDLVAVVETRTDTLLGPWDTNPATTNGRAHAGVFSPSGRKLYVASNADWRGDRSRSANRRDPLADVGAGRAPSFSRSCVTGELRSSPGEPRTRSP